MNIRAIIVDDEDLARRGIRALLARAPDVEVLAECANARDAITAVQAEQPDLVFLDVQMPGQSGFDVIAALGANDCPYVVFVTAHDEFAIRAFDVHALDYLLKPLSEQRFDMALQRVRKALAGAQESSMGRKLALLAAEFGRATDHTPSGLAPDRIPVKTGGRVIVVRVADIDWIKAEHDYVSLYVGDKAWLIRESIGAIEERLASAGFVRIHRSTLVNTERVKELRPLNKGEYQVILRTGVELKLSRNYRAALIRLAGADV